MNKAKYYLICFGSSTWDGRLHEYEAACRSVDLYIDKFFPGYWANRLDRYYAVTGMDQFGRSMTLTWLSEPVDSFQGFPVERIGKFLKAGALAEELFA